jgi:hypothetical protein
MMQKQWASPFNETLFWPTIGMAGASVVVLLVGGGLSELLGDKALFWVSLLLCAGLAAPCAGMVIGADTCRAGDDPVRRSTHGFVIGCSVLGGGIAAAVEVLVKFG